MDEAYDAILGAKDALGRRIKTSLEGKLMTALLVACILSSALLSIVKLGIVNPFDPAIWIRLGNQLLTSYLVFLMFIDPGERAEFARIEEHATVRRQLAELSAAISRDGLMSRFLAFCKYKATEGLESRRWQIYNRYMDVSMFAELCALSRIELKRKHKEGDISIEIYRAVRRATRLKLHTVRPATVLSADPSTPTEEIGERITYRQRKTLQRPVMLILWNVLVHSLTFMGTEAFSIGMLISIITTTGSIIISAFVGYDVGKNSAIWQTAQRQNRIRFLLEFEEWDRKK